MVDKCDDKKCFKHGGVKVRGEILNGKVVSSRGKHTVIVERTKTQYFPKYRKWARGTSRIAAHNPGCINAKVGDMVDLAETRKLSKTKAWTVTAIVQGEHL
ncbi:30S ribosomal protein S17 [Candidatus Bilamarchaeum dharawalense]|uniref:30S ribosomal protein S17 n=1 Tax=Candidatus Bilamarchaeum dharawalense TaxID=2885759 RepID=A0A5E4LQ14_9ARCH|nr:30S ribosomal protein S17 [Candidatus Bilamarchaeum dharawalense]